MFVMRNNCFKGGKSGQKASFSTKETLIFYLGVWKNSLEFPRVAERQQPSAQICLRLCVQRLEKEAKEEKLGEVDGPRGRGGEQLSR